MPKFIFIGTINIPIHVCSSSDIWHSAPFTRTLFTQYNQIFAWDTSIVWQSHLCSLMWHRSMHLCIKISLHALTTQQFVMVMAATAICQQIPCTSQNDLIVLSFNFYACSSHSLWYFKSRSLCNVYMFFFSKRFGRVHECFHLQTFQRILRHRPVSLVRMCHGSI